MILLLAIATLVFLYHYERNGNPLHFEGNFVPRLFWAVGCAAVLVLLSLPGFPSYLWIAVLVTVVASFVQILVPHAYPQNMGRWPTPQNKWPSLFYGNYTQAEWDAMTPSQRERSDFIKMGCVGFIRGLIVFVPLAFLYPWFLAALSVAITAIWQPLSYYVGWRTPWAIWNNKANDAEWGEFYIGIGWALAFWALTGFHVWF